MGQGSDVAKNASELVLTGTSTAHDPRSSCTNERLDDNFDSIRAAISEGRRIFDNIQRFIMHLLSTNIAEVVLLVFGLAFQDNSEDRFPYELLHTF